MIILPAGHALETRSSGQLTECPCPIAYFMVVRTRTRLRESIRLSDA
jgi:hypothetical protein